MLKPPTQAAAADSTRDTNDDEPQPVPSPCNQVCRLDAQDLCEGCHRSREEITRWTRMTAAEQRVVLAHCRERSAGRNQRAAAPVAG